MTHFFSRRYFVSPPYVTLDDYTAMPELGVKTYTEYDYLTPGIASFLRTGHFEYALRLTREYFHKCNVIDFGCADGPFLPSLARYFNHVVGVDMRPVDVQIAEKVIGAAGLSNVEVVCNRGLTMADLKSRLGERQYHIAFLLETLEHVGDKADLWGSRVELVKELFELLGEGGIVVIEVPVMVGMPFLLQRLGLLLLN